MTRINQVDQALLVLREQLQRMSKARGQRTEGARRSERSTPKPMARLSGLATLDALPDDQLRRTLVRALLAEELGDAIAADPAFASVSDDVFRMLSESEEGQELMAQAARQLRSGNQTN